MATAQRGYERSAWEDRFNRPTVEALRAGLRVISRRLFDSLHRQLGDLEAVTVGLAWHGACWRWTVEYRTRLDEEPLAVLIPSPENLQVAVPLDREFVTSLPVGRMTRALRDGLNLAQEPFDTRWGVWSIGASGLVDDVMDLVERKLRHLARQAG